MAPGGTCTHLTSPSYATDLELSLSTLFRILSYIARLRSIPSDSLNSHAPLVTLLGFLKCTSQESLGLHNAYIHAHTSPKYEIHVGCLYSLRVKTRRPLPSSYLAKLHRRKLVKNIGEAHCLPPPIAFPSRPRVLLYAANLIKSNMHLLGICRKSLTN